MCSNLSNGEFFCILLGICQKKCIKKKKNNKKSIAFLSSKVYSRYRKLNKKKDYKFP